MKIKKGFILRSVKSRKKVDGKDVDVTQNVVVAIGSAAKDFKAMLFLNETGAFIWKLLEKGTTEDKIISDLSEEYDAERTQIESDVKEILKKLIEVGVIDE